MPNERLRIKHWKIDPAAGTLEHGEPVVPLIGEDPTQSEPLNRRMDAALKGHPHTKSAIDVD